MSQSQPVVYGAVYSGVPVYEMTCRQVSVMRRRLDSYMNATQILKVAGVDKGRRTKILEREIQIGEHEKVQGGYGKYQGTWIPYERSYELARQYGVDELLRPLFEFVPGPDDDMETPRKKRPRASSRLSNSSLPVTNSHMMNNDAVSTRKRGFSDANHPGMVPQPIHNNENYPPFYHQLHPHHQPFPSHLQSAQVRPMSANSERYRAMLMSIFLNHENHKLPDLITSPHTPPDLDIDLIIDDQGHTSLHWAAALSRINVLQLLLNHGADPRRVNFNGESALIRAALVTNNFDNDSFYDLLILLHPAIDIVDKKGRSIVHHIALTAGIKGRVQASRYYLDTMLDMMQKNGIDIRSIIDLQDKNGDTALNIAARIGNRSLVEQMLKSGANAEIPNRAGLRPLDFGLEDVKLASLFQSKGDVSVPAISGKESSPFCLYLTPIEGEGGTVFQDSSEKIRVISKELAESRRVIQALACRVAGLERRSAVMDDGNEKSLDTSNRADQLEVEIVRLKALLQSHGVTVPDWDFPTMEESENGNVLDSTDAKVNQLLAQVLNVPMAVSDSLVDPLLTAVNSESQIAQLMRQAHQIGNGRNSG